MMTQFKKILSLYQDGAVSFLLIIEEKYKVLLDCGISHNFDFVKYREIANELKDVQLVLISHSALEYSGAIPFLITELGLSPKIFYTTQPIMRYSPLNLHEEILNLRLPNYNPKVFNRIYSEYEEINLVKPYQKKEIVLMGQTQMQDQNESIKQTDKKIHFCCYLAGGYLGSVYWRISFGLINIVYLVDYNNYSMQHIGGLDIDNLKSQSTHLLITDVYSKIGEDSHKKEKLYQDLKHNLINFYQQRNIDITKPKMFNIEHDDQLLISCYPSEIVVQVLAVMRKIVSELQQENKENGYIQKIGVVHLSSRFLELVKSQSEYFQPEFKGMLQKLNEYFKQSLKLQNRINICSFHSTRGTLVRSDYKNLTYYQIMCDQFKDYKSAQIASNNLKQMTIFDIPQKMQEEQDPAIEVKQENERIKSQHSLHQIQLNDEKKPINSKYISSISGIPKFIMDKTQNDEEITQFGLRHHTNISERTKQITIHDIPIGQRQMLDQASLSKKQSKIEVMNVSFDLPSESSDFSNKVPSEISRNIHRTDYMSSLKIIQLIKPNSIIFVNVPTSANALKNYQNDVPRLFNKQFQSVQNKKINVFNSNVKKNCYLSFENRLLQYKMNYLPEMQQKRVQRVKGIIKKEGNCMHIHLDCLQDKEIQSFRLQKFYVSMKRKVKCRFVGSGIQIQGIKLYRKQNEIILQGEYSEQYFKVRKQLYQFLGIR